ncbi:hypothetical protein [Halocola ammonii]
MKDFELKSVISELERRNVKDEAYFGFYQYGGAPDESCIKANRKGLELFAAEILKAATESYNRKFDKGKAETTGLDLDWIDENSDFFFDHVELTNKDKQPGSKSFPKNEENWKGKMVMFGFIGIGIGLIALAIIGIGTIVSWL